MRHLPTIARFLMGLVFFVFGLSGFLHFIPEDPTGMPEGAIAFATAMKQTGYLLELVKGTETLVGFLLLTNLFVPLALTLIAPVVVNIFAFHLFLAPLPSGMGMASFLVLLEIYLAWSYRGVYRPMLARRVTPTAG